MNTGEFYPEISGIISETEAWDQIHEFHRDEIQGEINELVKLHQFDEDSATDYILDEWHKQGISAYEGFFQRKDGLVEVSANV